MSDITVGSVAVDIVPDTRGFAEKLKAKLAGLSAEIGLSVDTSGVRSQLEELTRPRSATITANAETTKAKAQLDDAARTRNAKINADTRGLGGLFGDISGMAALIGGLGPALIPVTAAVTGLALALGAPLAAAGGGLTIFGLIGGAAIAKTQKVAKQIAELKKRANTLVDPKAKAAAAAQAAALEATLTGPQKAFLHAKETLGTAFAALLKGVSGRDIFGPINQGMKLLAQIMPALAPVIHSVSGALSDILRSVGQSAKSGGLKDFLGFLSKAAGPTIKSFAKILVNIGTGFAGLFGAFAPVGASLTQGLIDLTGSFAKFGQTAGSNKGLQKFIAYVKDVGPKVAKTLGDIVGAAVNIGRALAPLGAVVLVTLDAIAKFIAKADPKQLALFSGLIGALVLAMGALGGPVILIVPAIVAMAAGLVQAYNHSKRFRDIVQNLVGWVRDQLFPALKHAVEKILPSLKSAFDIVKQSIKDNQPVFKLLADAFGALGKYLTDVLIPVWTNIARVVIPLMALAFAGTIGAINLVVQVWLAAIGFILDGAARAFGWIPGIGGKLKKAAADFDLFRDQVNGALDGIHNVKTITLKVTTQQLVANPSLGKPRALPGNPEGAGARGAIINRPTVFLAGEAGREALIPLDRTDGNSPLPGGLAGPQFNVEKVVAQDVNDFLRQMQTRSRMAGTSGVR